MEERATSPPFFLLGGRAGGEEALWQGFSSSFLFFFSPLFFLLGARRRRGWVRHAVFFFFLPPLFFFSAPGQRGVQELAHSSPPSFLSVYRASFFPFFFFSLFVTSAREMIARCCCEKCPSALFSPLAAGPKSDPDSKLRFFLFSFFPSTRGALIEIFFPSPFFPFLLLQGRFCPPLFFFLFPFASRRAHQEMFFSPSFFFFSFLPPLHRAAIRRRARRIYESSRIRPPRGRDRHASLPFSPLWVREGKVALPLFLSFFPLLPPPPLPSPDPREVWSEEKQEKRKRTLFSWSFPDYFLLFFSSSSPPLSPLLSPFDSPHIESAWKRLSKGKISVGATFLLSPLFLFLPSSSFFVPNFQEVLERSQRFRVSIKKGALFLSDPVATVVPLFFFFPLPSFSFFPLFARRRCRRRKDRDSVAAFSLFSFLSESTAEIRRGVLARLSFFSFSPLFSTASDAADEKTGFCSSSIFFPPLFYSREHEKAKRRLFISLSFPSFPLLFFPSFSPALPIARRLGVLALSDDVLPLLFFFGQSRGEVESGGSLVPFPLSFLFPSARGRARDRESVYRLSPSSFLLPRASRSGKRRLISILWICSLPCPLFFFFPSPFRRRAAKRRKRGRS